MRSFVIFQTSAWYRIGIQFSSVTQSCPTLCDPVDCSTPGLPVHHQLPGFTQTHVHRVGDAIQPSHPVVPLSSCSQSLPVSGSFPMSQLFDRYYYLVIGTSLVAQTVKASAYNAGDLGWGDPLEKEMAAHSSIVAWKIP